MKHRVRAAKQRRHKPRYRFTKKDCQRGYRAALEKCSQDWDLFAWLYHKLKRYYRRREDKL